MKRWRSALAFVVLLSFAGGSAALLHRLGSAPWSRIDWAHLETWLHSSSTEDVVAALLRLIALGLAYWLLASALLYALARASRMPRAITAARWVTLPVVRRVVDRAVALAVIASASVGPAARAATGPSPAPPPVTVQVSGDGVISPPSADIPGPEPSPTDEGSTQKGAPSPASGPTPGSTLPPGIDSPPSLEGDAGSEREPGSEHQAEHEVSETSEPEPPVDGRRRHAVVPGDNLWDIAAAHITRAKAISASDLSDDEIRRYWISVIKANRDSLRSGDPNLIYPGEVIRLPSLPNEGS